MPRLGTPPRPPVPHSGPAIDLRTIAPTAPIHNQMPEPARSSRAPAVSSDNTTSIRRAPKRCPILPPIGAKIISPAYRSDIATPAASTAPVGKLTAASNPNPKMSNPSIVKPTENDQMLIGPGFSNRGPMRFDGFALGRNARRKKWRDESHGGQHHEDAARTVGVRQHRARE